jgi:hypothetical protein
MISLLMLHADEGFWAGDKKAEGKLKDLVTGKFAPNRVQGQGGVLDQQLRAAVRDRQSRLGGAGSFRGTALCHPRRR